MSKTTQAELQNRFNLTVYAQAQFKRPLAERAVKEVKLRLAIALDLAGKKKKKKRLRVVRQHTLVTIFCTPR